MHGPINVKSELLLLELVNINNYTVSAPCITYKY